MSMATPTVTVAPSADKKSGAFRNYEDWFTQSPDPWVEIAALTPGGDRSFATTVQRLVSGAEPAQRAAMEAKLLAALARPAITATGTMFVCRMLAIVGTERSVPALGALLGEAATADAARYALEAIPGNVAAAALRGALGRLDGTAKAGLIGGIAFRGDKLALGECERIATNPSEPTEVRAAAARAVARLHFTEEPT
jgi:hypothetical protein